jgi:hypothetical protein
MNDTAIFHAKSGSNEVGHHCEIMAVYISNITKTIPSGDAQDGLTPPKEIVAG